MAPRKTAVACAILASAAFLTGAGQAQMTFHLDPLVIEALQTSVSTNPDTFLYRTDSDVQSAKFEEYRDLDSGFNLPLLHLWGETPDDDRYFDFTATNAGRDDARYGLAYGSWGGWAVELDYNNIVHRFGNEGLMLHQRTGPGRFELSDSMQASLQATLEAQKLANAAAINYPYLRGLLTPFLEAAGTVDIGLRRDRTALTFDLGRMAALGWTLEIKNENREGTRPYGAAFGFSNAIELVEPIDYQTSSAELRGEWGTRRAGVQFGVRYSKFENAIDTMIWDNPFRVTDSTDPNAYSSPGSGSVNGSAHGFADLAPDNDAALAFVNGRYRFGEHGFATGRLSYQRLEQDDELLPYTLNSAIKGINFNGTQFDATNAANLPESRFDGQVDILDAAVDVGTRFADRFDVTFRYRYYDYDDKSPRIEFPGYVRFHAVWEPIIRFNVPYSYTSDKAALELGWDVTQTTNLQLGVERRGWDRDYAETEGTTEDAIRLSADTRAIDNLTLRASFEHGTRDIDGEYDAERGGGASFEEPESTQAPGLRKFNQAASDYDQWRLQAEYLIGEKVTLAGTWQGRKDDYDESAKGLTEGEIQGLGAELNYQLRDSASLYLFVNRDDVDYLIEGRQSGATPSVNPLDNWTGDFEDTTDTLGLGFRCEKCGRWEVDFSGNWSRSDGDADLFSPPGGTPDFAVGFSDYDDIELLALHGRVDYRLNEHVSAGASVLWEDYDASSFLTNGLVPYLPSVLLLDQVNGSYTGNVLGLHLKFEM